MKVWKSNNKVLWVWFKSIMLPKFHFYFQRIIHRLVIYFNWKLSRPLSLPEVLEKLLLMFSYLSGSSWREVSELLPNSPFSHTVSLSLSLSYSLSLSLLQHDAQSLNGFLRLMSYFATNAERLIVRCVCDNLRGQGSRNLAGCGSVRVCVWVCVWVGVSVFLCMYISQSPFFFLSQSLTQLNSFSTHSTISTYLGLWTATFFEN